MRFISRFATACGALSAGLALPAEAGTLQVNPTLVEVHAERRSASVTVRNEEAQPVTIRAYALAWRQADGEDLYEETEAVIVSPPIATVAPGAAQLVRVALRRPGGDAAAYRLIIEEVPEAHPDGGIQVALRLNLPLYASMAAGDPARLAWSAARTADGWQIEAINEGEGYVRVDAAMARSATGLGIADNIGFGTVLPGATRRWSLPGAAVSDAGEARSGGRHGAAPARSR